MRRTQHHHRLSANFRSYLGQQRTDNRRRLVKLGKYLLRQTELCNQLAVILLCSCVDQSARRSLGVLVLFYARKQIGQVLRHHQKVRHAIQTSALVVVIQLVNCIERLELYARMRVQLGKRHNCVYLVYACGGTFVAVGKVRTNVLVALHQHVIHTPSIYRHALYRLVLGNCRRQTVFYLGKKRCGFPHQSVARALHAVAKTIHFV